MAEISAAAVKTLRDRTGLPMMECKKALVETNGDQEAAVEKLRKEGAIKMQGRDAERETACGRMAVYADVAKGVGALVELRCESDPVVKLDEFVQLAKDLATQLATGPGAKTVEELRAQKSPSKPGLTLGDQLDDLTNRIREVFRITRMLRVDEPCGGYAHHTGTDGVLVMVKGGTQQAANEIAMHVAAMKPKVAHRVLLDAAEVQKERDFQIEMARKEGKPENIISKMIEGRMRLFCEQHVLVDQPFVKEEKKTVAKIAEEAKMEIVGFHHWKLGG